MLLIFDCDGVVLDSMHLHADVESLAFRAIGIDIAPSELSRRFAGVSDEDAYQILEQETGIPFTPAVRQEITRQKQRAFKEHLKPLPYMKETLDALATHPRCIASGSSVAGLNFMLGLTGLLPFFAPHIYSAEMVARGKPFPDLFLHAADRMGATPATSLVIEDGVAGVEAARAANMRVLGFVGGSHCDPAYADRLYRAGAEHVFSDMRELPELISLKNPNNGLSVPNRHNA